MVKLIEACKKSGVATFSGNGLKLSFFKEQMKPAEQMELFPQPLSMEYLDKVTSEMKEESQNKPHQEMDIGVSQTEVESKEEQLAILLIEDPLQYEELIAQQDLVEKDVETT
jgi:hypothetical protein